MSVETACQFPIRTALSGPSAGVIGALFIGNAMNQLDLITFDMGGTSTDVCLLEKGISSISNDRWVGGYPAKIPSVDVNAVGAGGGSIAWIDLDGLMKVGPKSAGASPGPACYGLGGTEPTVTDANVILGRLNPEYLLGGRMKINRSLVRIGIETPRREAWARADGNRSWSDPDCDGQHGQGHPDSSRSSGGMIRRSFPSLPLEEPGPLHAVGVARELDISKVIVPLNPGILCAMGLMVADARNDYVRRPL